MLEEEIRPKIERQFDGEPPIGLTLLDDPYGMIGRYNSPRADGKGGWTDGVFVYDGRNPEQL